MTARTLRFGDSLTVFKRNRNFMSLNSETIANDIHGTSKIAMDKLTTDFG